MLLCWYNVPDKMFHSKCTMQGRQSCALTTTIQLQNLSIFPNTAHYVVNSSLTLPASSCTHYSVSTGIYPLEARHLHAIMPIFILVLLPCSSRLIHAVVWYQSSISFMVAKAAHTSITLFIFSYPMAMDAGIVSI